MTDFRMNQNKPIGSRNLTTIAGYNVKRPPAPKPEPPKRKFEVVRPLPPDLVFGPEDGLQFKGSLSDNIVSVADAANVGTPGSKMPEDAPATDDMPVQMDTPAVDEMLSTEVPAEEESETTDDETQGPPEEDVDTAEEEPEVDEETEVEPEDEDNDEVEDEESE
jgi:hypothetical protein